MISQPARMLALHFLVLATSSAAARQTVPVLRYNPPANFYRGASTDPEQYSSNEVNAGIQVYRFRPISGDLKQMLEHSLLREWIDPQFRETNVAAPPIWGRDSIPGAEAVYTVHFIESVVGIVHEHVRIIIVSSGAAAIVDASAATQESWRRAGPALQAMYTTLRVESAPAPPSVASGPGPAGRTVAGLYMGSRTRYMPNLNRAYWQGDNVPALHYYLFSSDGHLYRFYDVPGDLDRFDFERAARDDPDNSGRYTVEKGQLYIQMEGQPPQTITTPLPQGNRLVIETIVYLRQ